MVFCRKVVFLLQLRSSPSHQIRAEAVCASNEEALAEFEAEIAESLHFLSKANGDE
jgi:hypothetical protein